MLLYQYHRVYIHVSCCSMFALHDSLIDLLILTDTKCYKNRWLGSLKFNCSCDKWLNIIKLPKKDSFDMLVTRYIIQSLHLAR